MTTNTETSARTIDNVIAYAMETHPRVPGNADECIGGMLVDITYQGVERRARISLKAGVMLENIGARVTTVPSFEQRRTAAQWDAAGIGAD